MITLLMALACAPKVELESKPGSEIPEIGAAREFTPVEPQEAILESGARLWLVEDPGLPVALIRVILPGGSSADGASWGQADLAAQMLTEAAGGRSSLEISGELRLLASGLWASSGRGSTEVGLSSHIDRLDEGMELLAEKAPQIYYMHGERVEANLMKRIGTPTPKLFTLADFNRPALVLDLPTVLYGKTETGKSAFAKAHFRKPAPRA